MRKLMYLFTLIFLSSLNITAQNIVLTFEPKDATNYIDSIKAIKVNSNETAFTESSNTINMSSFTTGTKSFPINGEEISVYPNPFENYTQLLFHSNQNDNIKVSLINAAGQIVAEKNQNITYGIYQFNISTNKKGLYILNVIGNQTKFSQKIISTKNNQSLNKIEYIGYSSMSLKEKFSKIDNSELIFFYVYSGDKITKIADSPAESKTYEIEFYECKDKDGKNYPIVQIGEQWWMAENLAYDAGNGCWAYDYNENNVSMFGRLYNGEVAKTACPAGWHLPTDDEWKQIELAMGISQSETDTTGWRGTNEGTKLKGTNWWKNDGNGTDDLGFSALPGGYFSGSGIFGTIEVYGYFWSSTEHLSSSAWFRRISFDKVGIYRNYGGKTTGFSVRGVKD